MSKIPIGTKVKVLDTYYKDFLCGRVGTVVAYTNNSTADNLVEFEELEGHFNLHNGNGISDRPLDRKKNKRWINPKDLEMVKEENKQMEKKDLKSGMTVKLRNGYIYLVVEDLLSNERFFDDLENYKNDLTCEIEKTLDIVEVYQYRNSIYNKPIHNLKTLLDITNPNMKLLWKRQELPKLSSVERVILENLDKQYKWVARDKSDELWMYNEKPLKRCERWNVEGYANVIPLQLPLPKLFTFVKWEDEQPYSIEELLKGEK